MVGARQVLHTEIKFASLTNSATHRYLDILEDVDSLDNLALDTIFHIMILSLYQNE